MTAFNLKDLGMAYRKAKVDLYYSSHPRLADLASYDGLATVELGLYGIHDTMEW